MISKRAASAVMGSRAELGGWVVLWRGDECGEVRRDIEGLETGCAVWECLLALVGGGRRGVCDLIEFARWRWSWTVWVCLERGLR